MIFRLTILSTLWILSSGEFKTRKDQKPRGHESLEPVLYPPDYCKNSIEGQDFDFIVVGSGPAGATVGRRLAENPHHKVLILEAGGDPPEASDVMHHDVPLEGNQKWSIQAEASSHYCLSFPSGRCQYTLAKVLGGNSVINYMNYIRGNARDWDELASMGIKGWSYHEMLPYFKKLENYTVQEAKKAGDFHSRQGPLTVNRFPSDPCIYPFKMDILKAISHEGLPINKDMNGASQIGFGINPGMVERTGYRNNVAKAYLLNIPDNLKICKHAMVLKLLVSSHNSISGLQFSHAHGGKKNKVKAKVMTIRAQKEYILAAGPINTPQILERSGIGRKDVLEDADVEVKLELAGVGENLHDRFANKGNSYVVNIENQAAEHPFAAGIWNLQGFLNLADHKNPVPDMQFSGSTPLKVYKPDVVAQYDVEDYIFELSPTILRQAKPGYVHITQAKNPDSPPKLHVNQYSSKAELDQLIKGARLVRKIMRSKVLESYKIKPFTLKECGEHKYGSEEEILCHAKHTAVPLYNFAGTCKMGPANDKMAVVDNKLKLHGISGLRIVDLSVLPKNPRGGAEIPTIALAERAADLIKADWKDDHDDHEDKKTTEKPKHPGNHPKPHEVKPSDDDDEKEHEKEKEEERDKKDKNKPKPAHKEVKDKQKNRPKGGSQGGGPHPGSPQGQGPHKTPDKQDGKNKPNK